MTRAHSTRAGHINLEKHTHIEQLIPTPI
jgi:hypothetical protein